MKNMGNCHDHYLKKDVLFSADVLKSLLILLKILWAISLSLSQFFWIELGCDVKNDWCKIRKNIRHWEVLIPWVRLRGGISHIAKRFAKANDKYTNDYDPKKPSAFITYLDMNNLYGWAMSEYLPYGEFKWLKMLMSLIWCQSVKFTKKNQCEISR